MSWMLMATSWAPPRSQPDMWVSQGLGSWWWEQQQGGYWFPKRFHSSGAAGYSTLALSSCLLLLTSPPPSICLSPGLAVWPSHSCSLDIPASLQLPSPHHYRMSLSRVLDPQDLSSPIC